MTQSDTTSTTSTATSSINNDQVAANQLSFSACCRMLEAVERTPKGDAKLHLVFSDALRQEVKGGDLYPLMRLILPQLDRERTYNLKEKKIAKVYVDILGMASESKDAKKLEHFNDPTVVQSKSVGDFAAVLYEVLAYRSLVGNKKNQHTVGYVNELLDQLVQANDHVKRKRVFMNIVTEFPPNEQKWLIRIMLKDLKIGLKHERVLNYIHPDATEMYNHTNDLHRVCRELRNSKLRYAPKMEPFQVFSPMLAKRVEFGEAVTAINAESFVMEPKLDGERITCHIKGEEVQFISRNGINYTELYGPSMIPYIQSQVMQGVDCILDGEMMVWDNLEYKLREFGLLKNVANAFRSGESESHRWLCYIVWDIVYLGGDDTTKVDTLLQETYHGAGEVTGVMGLPLFARRKLLLKIVKPLDHRVMIIEQKIVNAKSQKERHEIVMAEVDQQIANGGEGVILKDLQAHYMCGESSRKTKRWIKLKPDYAGMTTNLDVIILGGFYGTGRRRSGDVSVFLVGVLSRSVDEEEAEQIEKLELDQIPSFYSFAKVGTGYNLEELEQMRRELEPHWRIWDKDKIPPHFNGWIPQRNDLKPDVWIDPRHSKILEVYGFELTFTTLYQTGLTIRFPRCKSIRHDKPWYSCLTAQELNAARKNVFNNKRAADVALGQKKKLKRVKTSNTKGSQNKSTGVLTAYAQAKLQDVQIKKNIFEGMEFCVLPGTYQLTKHDHQKFVNQIFLDTGITATGTMNTSSNNSSNICMNKQLIEKLIHAFGGILVQNPLVGSTDYVVASSGGRRGGGLKLVNLKKQGLFNIVSLQWLVTCMEASRLVPLKARDFLFATQEKQKELSKEYDCYGDHYTEEIKNPMDLKEIFQQVQISQSAVQQTKWWQELIQEMILEEEEEVMACEFTCLSHCLVHIVSDDDEEKKILEQSIRVFSGRVSDCIDSKVTHVVLLSTEDKKMKQKVQQQIQKLRHGNKKEPPVVNSKWVDECIHQRVQLPVYDFFIPL